MIQLEDEYENGYTLYGNNDKVVISNQKVSKKVSFYHTQEYQDKIDSTGKFEFTDLTDQQIILLKEKVQSLTEHIE